jgi:hypothetical protein
VEAIDKLGGSVRYDYRCDSSGKVILPLGPTWRLSR